MLCFRWPLWVRKLVGPLISLIVLLFTPESVRWLMSQNKMDEVRLNYNHMNIAQR